MKGYDVVDPATGKKTKVGGGYDLANTQGLFDTAARLRGLSGATSAQQLQGYETTDPVTGQKINVGGGYMNPYIKDVVSEIGRLGRRQLQESMPGIIGQSTGLGGFGSKRALEAAGIAGRESLANILGQQSGVLSAGYDAAQKAAQADLAKYLQGATSFEQLGQSAQGMAQSAAQADLARFLQSAGTLGQLGQTGYGMGQSAAQADLARYLQGAGTLGQLGQAGFGLGQSAAQGDINRYLQAAQAAGQLGQAGYQTAAGLAQGDLNRYLQGAQAMGGLGQIASGTNIAELQNLASLGAQQQAIAQGEENFPLQTAQAVSSLLRGYTMPTDVSSTYKGPLAGLQYSPSGLQQLSTLAGLFTPTGTAGTGKSAAQSIFDLAGTGIDAVKNSQWFKDLIGG